LTPVSTRAAFEFVEKIARREGIDHFGWRAADPAEMTPHLRRALNRSPTLFHALQTLCAGARRESSNVAFWLEERQETVSLCHRGSLETGTSGSGDASLMRTAIILSVLRMFMGANWGPTDCGLQLAGEIGPVVRADLPDTRISGTYGHGWLRLRRSDLARPLQHRLPVDAGAGAEAEEEELARDLVGSLAQTIRPLLSRSTPTVRDAAHMAYMSVRSLQRELALAGTSYRQLLGGVKFDMACELLRQPDVKILDVAHATGFTDQAHFTRFFGAWAGVSPREYRSARLEEVL
jgi:AraC-like DNA-binding protein